MPKMTYTSQFRAEAFTAEERAAAERFLRRKARGEHPEGEFDKAGRFWLAERCDCCAHIRPPSRAWPHSHMLHGRTVTHCAALHGVQETRVRRAAFLIKKIEAEGSDVPELQPAVVEVVPAAAVSQEPAVAVAPEAKPEEERVPRPERKARPRAAAGVAFLRSEGFMPARLPDGTMSFKRSGDPVIVVTGIDKSVALAKQFKISIFEEEPAEGVEPRFVDEADDLKKAIKRAVRL